MENKERELTMKAEKAEDGRSCEAESRSVAWDGRAVFVRETAALLKMFNNSRSPEHFEFVSPDRVQKHRTYVEELFPFAATAQATAAFDVMSGFCGVRD